MSTDVSVARRDTFERRINGHEREKTNLLFSRGEWHYVTLFYKYNRLETSTTTRIKKQSFIFTSVSKSMMLAFNLL